MALPVTDNLRAGLRLPDSKPVTVLKIDGITNIFGNIQIKKYIKVGDPDLLIGNSWVIGGFNLISNQSPYITFNTGTTTRITQQLNPSKGQGTSVTQMSIVLQDVNAKMLKMVSPGQDVNEMMGRFCTVYQGIQESSWPEDYNVIFKGVVQGISTGPNTVTLFLSGTEEKKRAKVFTKVSVKTAEIVSIGETEIDLADASDFLTPSGILQTYVKINNELIKYTGKTGNTLTGCTRAQEGTVEVEHATNATAEQVLRLTENGIDLALRVMLSGGPAYYAQSIDVLSFVYFDTATQIDNAVFFEGIDLITDHGVAVGDTVEFTGATNGANNIITTIFEVGRWQNGSYILLNDDVVVEASSPAVAKFKTPYNTLPIGLAMIPREVDVAQHLFIRDTFLSVATLDFFVKEIGPGKEFIETEIYFPLTCYSVPRKGTCSMVYHIGPLPLDEIVTLDETNVENPESLTVQRSLSENFFNEVVANYDQNIVSDEYEKIEKFESTKKSLIPVGDRPFPLTSRGLRTAQSGNLTVAQSARRYLKRYERGAEFIKGVQVFFKDGYAIEIGDIVTVDFTALKLGDYKTGTRAGSLKLFEVLNKTLDSKTGQVMIDIVNTIFDVSDRYGLISPASWTSTGSTTTKLRLKKSFGTKAFQRESTKWRKHIGQNILVRNQNFTTIYNTKILGFDNQDPVGMLIDAVAAPPGEDWIVELRPYPSSADVAEEFYWKSRYAFFSPRISVTNSVSLGQTQFEVAASKIARFKVGATVEVHNDSFSQVGPEAEVTVVDTVNNRVTIDTATGFNINNVHSVDLIGFPDGLGAYRIV